MSNDRRSSSSFDIRVTGNLVFSTGSGELSITLTVDTPAGAPLVEITITKPLTDFDSPEQFLSYLQLVKANFFNPVSLPAALAHETAERLVDATKFVGLHLGVAPDGFDAVIEDAIARRRERLIRDFSALPPETQTRSAWTPYTLQRAVQVALLELIDGGVTRRGLTLERVADVIREHYSDIAPASGEALGKRLERFKLDWKKLKTDTWNAAKVGFVG
jgi:hypothetical protein